MFTIQVFNRSVCAKRLVQQAIIWDKRDKSQEEIVKNLDSIKLKKLKQGDKFEYVFLIKKYKSLEDSLKYWSKITEQVKGKWVASAFLQWGYTLSQLQEWESAVEKLKLYHEKCKKPAPYSYVELSWCLRQQEKDEEAVSYALKAAKLLPFDLDAQMEAGLSNYTLQEYDKAIKYFSRAHEIDKDNCWVSERLGLALRFSKNYKEAIKIFNRCLKSMQKQENPDTAGVRFSIAMCRLATGKSPAAEKSLISLVEENQQYTKIALEELHHHYLENSQDRKWKNLILRLYNANPKIEPVIYYYALFLHSTGNSKEAIKLLKKVKTYDVEYLNSLIRIYFALEQYKKICTELKNYDGYHSDILSLHWDSLIFVKDLQKCREVTNRINEIWPENIWVMKRDCELLILEENLKEAKSLINDAIKLDPQPELYITKLETLIALKQKRGIKTILEFLKKSERDDLLAEAEVLLRNF